MKVRTLEELEDRLEQDISWRKKEIFSLKLLVDSDELNRRILLRAGIALLCAHFEGFIKSASNYYVVYIINKRIKCGKLVHPLLAIKLKEDFNLCSKTDKNSVHSLLINKLEEIQEDVFFVKHSDNNPIISTKSNPKSEILDEILKSIGVSSDIFDTKKQFIDHSLINNRNKVVHGERTEFDYNDFETLFNIVIELLENYKGLIILSAEQKVFIKNKIEVEYA